MVVLPIRDSIYRRFSTNQIRPALPTQWRLPGGRRTDLNPPPDIAEGYEADALLCRGLHHLHAGTGGGSAPR